MVDGPPDSPDQTQSSPGAPTPRPNTYAPSLLGCDLNSVTTALATIAQWLEH